MLVVVSLILFQEDNDDAVLQLYSWPDAHKTAAPAIYQNNIPAKSAFAIFQAIVIADLRSISSSNNRLAKNRPKLSAL